MHKTYKALDCERCIEILFAYGVGPRTERLIHIYWEGLTMLDRAGRYYGEPFKGSRGVTQEDLLSPKILNKVADAVIRHWETVVDGED